MRASILLALTLAAPQAGLAATYTLAPLSGLNQVGNFYPSVMLDNGASIGTLFVSTGSVGAGGAGANYLPVDYCGTAGPADNTEITAVSPDTSNRFIGGMCNGTAGYVHDNTTGTTTALNYLAYNTYVSGVNAGGLVVGEYYNAATGVTHGLYVVGSVYVPFDPPGSIGTSVFGISTQNTMFGGFAISATLGYGFLMDQYGHYTVIAPAGAAYTYVTGLNGRNVASGFYLDSANAYHAFAWKKGAVIQPPLPGGASSSTTAGINQKGVVAGTYSDSAAVPHGFVWSPNSGKMLTFGIPSGAYGLVINGVNNTHAQVTGYYYVGTTQTAFIATCSGSGCF